MTNEFKIKKFKDATVFTLESATSGGTSAGAVASVSSPMGGVRRRGDNLIAQEEKKEAPKPRNFVAKNAKMGGAGQHKDKKKEQKQGVEKHKKPYMEDLKGRLSELKSKMDEIKADPDYLRAAERSRSQARDTQRQYWRSPEEKAAARSTEIKRDKGIAGYAKRHRAANPDMYPTPKAQPAPKYRDSNIDRSDDYSTWAAGRRDTVAEGPLHEGKGLAGELAGFLKSNGFKGPYRLGKLPKWAADLSEFDKNSLIMVQGNDVEYDEFVIDIGYGQLYWGAEGGMTKMTEKAIMNHVQQGLAEDHEVQMASNELKSIHANAKRLLALVQQYGEQGDLEAWQQSKITKAADYLNSVLQSIGGEQDALDVDEDHSTVGGWGKGSYDTYAGTRHGRGVAESDTYFAHLENMLNEDWQKANRRDKTDGMSRKAVKAYRRENPGSKLKTAVTTKPSKLKKGGKAAKRRKSFCARMSGNKGPMKKPNGEPTPKALALRRWNCEEDAYMNSLNQQVLEKLNPQADVDVWVQDFQKADPNKYKQFKNKTPQKKAQMAVAAHYAANEPSKKK